MKYVSRGACSIASLAVYTVLSSFAFASELATKESPMAELKIGEKTYEKVYLQSYDEKTGAVSLKHAWGIRGIDLEKLTAEQQKALGIESTLSEKELAKNRKESEKKRLIFLAEESEKLKKLDGEMKKLQVQQKMNVPTQTRKASDGSVITTTTKNGIKTTITKKRVG